MLSRIYNKFYRYVNYPDLELSQYWDLEKQNQFQRKRFLKIFKYHYYYNFAYRTFCNDRGLKTAINDFKDIQKIPIITKNDFKNIPELKLMKNKYMGIYHTGGSTGEPLEYIGCKSYRYMRLKAHSRGWKYFGLKKSSDFITLASARGVMNDGTNLAGDLSEKNIKNIIDVLKTTEKEYIRSYASSIFLVAKKMNQLDIKVNRIKAVNLISENVYDWHKKEIQHAFPSSEIYEEYVCNDGGASAWECEDHSGLHESFERALIEPNNNGEMIVTDLWNSAMPFIRYVNGDYLVERKIIKCNCGRTTPKIKIKGRTNDILIGPEGPISPTYLMMWCAGYGYTGSKHNSGLNAIQYIQKESYRLVVNIEKNNKFNEEEFGRVKNEIKRICKNMDISYHFVKSIKSSKAGKRSFIINEDKKLLGKYIFNQK